MVGLLVVIASVPIEPQGTGRSPFDRAAVVRMLEAMLVTGHPAETEHDEGEWLQAAVADLIARGDGRIERLAVRAAAPLRVTISHPVVSVRDPVSPPALVVTAEDVLTLPRPVSYTARIFVSLDGGDLVEVWTQASGKNGGLSLPARLGEAVMRPGGHHLRVRAYLTFGAGKSAWTEVRDLPELFYAVYDLSQSVMPDGRALLLGPAAFTAADFDPALPPERLDLWVSQMIAPYRRPKPEAPMWMPHYCEHRAADPKRPVDTRAICAVLYFDTRTAAAGQLWFRTAEVQLLEDRVAWVPLQVPRFEGIIYGERNADRLSALGELLQSMPGDTAAGDLFIHPSDIVIIPGAVRRGERAEVAVTVRNRGQDWVYKALVTIHYGSDPLSAAGRRRFSVDIPPQGERVVRMEVRWPDNYGFAMAEAHQLSEHSPHEGVRFDPTPTDACAIRLLNANAAPPRVLAEFRDARDSMGCQVLIR